MHNFVLMREPLSVGLVRKGMEELWEREAVAPVGVVVNQADQERVAGYLRELGLALPLATARYVLVGEVWLQLPQAEGEQ